MYSTEKDSPVLLDISSVLDSDNSKLDFSEDVVIDGSGLSDGVTFDDSIKVSGRIENAAGYVSLKLEFELGYVAECARCLSEVKGREHCSVEKTVCRTGTLEDEEADDIILDYIVVDDDNLDLTSIVEEYIILEFPTIFLCSEDCKGLCPKCGKNLNEGECSCPKKEIDPRMEVFRDILNSYKSSDDEK